MSYMKCIANAIYTALAHRNVKILLWHFLLVVVNTIVTQALHGVPICGHKYVIYEIDNYLLACKWTYGRNSLGNAAKDLKTKWDLVWIPMETWASVLLICFITHWRIVMFTAKNSTKLSSSSAVGIVATIRLQSRHTADTAVSVAASASRTFIGIPVICFRNMMMVFCSSKGKFRGCEQRWNRANENNEYHLCINFK